MKQFLIILTLIFGIFFTSFIAEAQSQQAQTVSIPLSELTEQQKQKLNQDVTIEKVSAWTGVGKELGDAVNGAVGALTKHAVDFSETRLGTFTMFLIAAKILGGGIIIAIIGIPLLIAATGLFIWIVVRNGMNRRYIRNIDTYNKGKETEYTREDYGYNEPDYSLLFMSALCYVVFVGIFLIAVAQSF